MLFSLVSWGAENAGHEIARHENAAQKCSGEKMRSKVCMESRNKVND